ncbi:MAG: hypothetical protein IKW51_09725 [Bacteroidales bacterium]|nr:hypothetical protein [Bacteroidales bacterium]
MQEFILNSESLENYYEKYLQNDVKLTADSIGGCHYRDFMSPLLIVALEGPSVSPNARIYRFEDEVLYLSFMAFIFATESSLYRIMGGDKAKCESFMNEFGFLWLPAVLRKSINSYIFNDDNIHFQEDVEIISNALDIVKPFMKIKLEDFVTNRYSEKDADFNIGLLNEYIAKELEEALFSLRRSFFKYKGLVGIDVSRSKIRKYLDERFSEQFKGYFPTSTDMGGYLQTQYVSSSYPSLPRLEDGNPGSNPSENLMFSAILLYKYIAQQALLTATKNNYDAVTLFHKYTGWPSIYTGPGAGPYLHPLKMLEDAGLLPLKSEVVLFSEVLKDVISVLRQEFDAALNGREQSMKDNPMYDQFISTIRQGRIKHNIKVYMDEEVQNIQDLIVKWGESSTTPCYLFLEEYNLGTMIQMD